MGDLSFTDIPGDVKRIIIGYAEEWLPLREVSKYFRDKIEASSDNKSRFVKTLFLTCKPDLVEWAMNAYEIPPDIDLDEIESDILLNHSVSVTPAYYATIRGDIGVFEELLQRNCLDFDNGVTEYNSVYHKDTIDMCIDIAIRRGNIDMAKYLYRKFGLVIKMNNLPFDSYVQAIEHSQYD